MSTPASGGNQFSVVHQDNSTFHFSIFYHQETPRNACKIVDIDILHKDTFPRPPLLLIPSTHTYTGVPFINSQSPGLLGKFEDALVDLLQLVSTKSDLKDSTVQRNIVSTTNIMQKRRKT